MAVAVPFLALSVPAETFAACSYAYEVKTNYDEDYYRTSHVYKALKAWRDYKYEAPMYRAAKQVYKAPQRDWYEVSKDKDYWYDRDSKSWYEVTSTTYWTEQDSWNYFNRDYDYNENSWRSSYRSYWNDKVPAKKATVKKATIKYYHNDYNDYYDRNDYYDYDYDYYDYDYDRDYDHNYNRTWNRTNYNNRNDRNYWDNDDNYRYEYRSSYRYWDNDPRFIGG